MIENYEIDRFGVIHQINFKPKVYDKEYLTYYQDLSDRSIKLGYQRWGWLLGMLGRIPESVLEIGYGTGSFIEAAQVTGTGTCAGCDIANYPLPVGVEFLGWDQVLENSWEVVAMFDVLEHIPDLSFLSKLKTRYLAVAVPFCRWSELGDEWLRDWRMLLPDEHLHHFDECSLVSFLDSFGYSLITMNTFEDGIRLRPNEVGPNIISACFERMI